jgi:Tfp pilus assembly protein PilX
MMITLNNKGSVTIFAMMVLFISVIIILAMFMLVESEIRLNFYQMSKVRAYALAESGVNSMETVWGYYGFPVTPAQLNTITLDLDNDGNAAAVNTIHDNINHTVTVTSTATVGTSTITITALYQDLDENRFSFVPGAGRRRIGWTVQYQ